MAQRSELMDKIVALSKRRGFILPGSEIYGGLANAWDFGPLGVELKNNIKLSWWKRFVQLREDMVGLDAAIIMNPEVWVASGHVGHFHDPLVEDKVTHERYRLDHLLEEQGVDISGMSFEEMANKLKELNLKSPAGNPLTEPKQFNMMFKTHLGPVADEKSVVYLRPETAQAIFADFKQIIDTSRKRPPFGVAQIGKAFRNEITPGNFIFRTREFEQMEIEYFIPEPKKDEQWQEYFEQWVSEVRGWSKDDLGLNLENVVEHEIPEEERAHYSKRTIDFEYKFPFGQKELYGLAYRTDYDLRSHEKHSGVNMKYKDPVTNEEYWPHVIEPSFGVERSVLAVLVSSYCETEDKRIVMKFPAKLAPYKAAVFPLLANKPELVEKAKLVFNSLKPHFMVSWDDRGNIGKRYASQDEAGTPFCITIDFDTIKDDTVTVRDRDTATQVRVRIDKLIDYISERIK
ncbi:MAG: Glycine-tRNA ligase [Candidatus Daviesbacteria bacterium GW2011_GWA2_38_24]|uniref:glycine--tRNA ligase n=1 Tax=Candidatus Daviesbacteria bacterium GW2011_GWA2_38_24 TaxID=1618422 RepID=A0A0G0JK20_9BACT|nr:MAG: Glycine-tRNA ligase [Candidatus Daviesbacteria bacterium GW2011_GWA2_38_24]OGE23316.1 MAG: glycine--tRNA ligase [Candidatus Daviesbacteria bacterium RIFCSPHIGHO2_01_FULL_38_8]